MVTPAEHQLPIGPTGPRLPRGLERFLHTEAASGVVLVVAAAVALAWANSPWRHGYLALWETPVTFRVGSVDVAQDLRHFVNDGLMAVFFLLVGLEIKREMFTGELRGRTATLPVAGALGGMALPALVYLALNPTGVTSRGWGIPMATDIAFAVGVLALLSRRAPAPLRVFLLALAVVDDIGAIVVIAVFYSGDLHWGALGIAAALVAAIAALRTRVPWTPLHAVLGVGVWLALFRSGVHPTIAGVVLGLLAPASPRTPAISVAERLEQRLHPLTSFVIMPAFALANAGVVLRRDALGAPGAGRVALGVVLGLVVGKVVGIAGAAWVAVQLRLAALPDGVRPAHLVGAAALAGIGFTVSLFVSGLAFENPALEDAAKLGILGASLVASALGAAVLASTRRPPGRTGRDEQADR